MKNIKEKIAFWLRGKNYVYNSYDVVVLADKELSEHIQLIISESIRKDREVDKIRESLNKTLLENINKHKGTIEDGKCFLEAKEFVIGLNKEGKVVNVKDCSK